MDAWLFSHLHGDHYSVYYALCTGTHNTGVIRTRHYMMAQNPKKDNIYPVINDILSTPLPMDIY